MRSDKFYRNLCVTLAVGAGIAVLYTARSLLTPVVTALVVAYVFYPLVHRAANLGFPKGAVISVILLALLGGLFYGSYSVIPAVQGEFNVLTSHEQKSQSQLVKIFMNVSEELRKYGIIKQEIDPVHVTHLMRQWLKTQSALLLQSLGDIAREAFQFLLIFLFVLIFALKDGDELKRTLIGFIPNAVFEPGVFMLHKTTILFGCYLRGLVLENVILAIITFLMLVVLTFFTPLTIAMSLLITIVITLGNVIRVVGPIIGLVVSAVLVLTTSADLVALVGVCAIDLIGQILDTAILLPMIMQDQMDLNPVVCLLAVLVGGILAGILGMMLAIPVTGGIKVMYHIITVEMKKFNMDPEGLSG